MCVREDGSDWRGSKTQIRIKFIGEKAGKHRKAESFFVFLPFVQLRENISSLSVVYFTNEFEKVL